MKHIYQNIHKEHPSFYRKMAKSNLKLTYYHNHSISFRYTFNNRPWHVSEVKQKLTKIMKPIIKTLKSRGDDPYENNTYISIDSMAMVSTVTGHQHIRGIAILHYNPKSDDIHLQVPFNSKLR